MFARLLLAGAAHVANAAATAAPAAGTDWRAPAATDLEAARAAIRASHPGYIDDQNPAFRGWEAKGYEEARALLPRVNSYDSMLAAVRYYVAGFEDGHLGYSDNIRKDDRLTTAGWRLEYQDGAYRVSGVMPHWPQPLPPAGAELLSCDGVAPEQRLRHIRRYYDGRDLPGVRHDLASVFTLLDMPGEELKRCRFRTAQGKEVALAQHYGQVKPEDFMALRQVARIQRVNGWTLQDGVLWVRAGNFQPDRAAAQHIDKMLDELPRLEGFHTVVFDSRGNGGGNSAIGARLFEAATGGLAMDQGDLAGLPRSFAQWRVSDAAIQGMDMRLERIGAAQGKDSTDFKWVSDLRERLLKAKAEGQPWVEQPGSVRLSRADIVARNGKLRRFSGKVVLVTDEHCASACLDFADLVRSVPGAIHMGEATSADTIYMDIGRVGLPSGNHLVVPLKVWRNRLRGNNEVLQPDVALQVNIRDDAAVRRAVLAALPR
jgi:hypothetical protein